MPIPLFVMAGLDPAIYVLLAARPKDVDARDKPGHDEILVMTKARAGEPLSSFQVPSAADCVMSSLH
jgi:hypothetical protein